MAFVALHDASVLHPGSLRDLLIRLGRSGFYQAKWTEQILDEALAAIVRDQPELVQRLDQTRELMRDAIPDATVTGYEDLIPSLELPDPGDRHVLAAAIACNAQVIITSNLYRFPEVQLQKYNIEAQRPDEFIFNVIELAPARVVNIMQQQAQALTRPAMTFDELLERFRTLGLPRAAAATCQQLGPD